MQRKLVSYRDLGASYAAVSDARIPGGELLCSMKQQSHTSQWH